MFYKLKIAPRLFYRCVDGIGLHVRGSFDLLPSAPVTFCALSSLSLERWPYIIDELNLLGVYTISALPESNKLSPTAKISVQLRIQGYVMDHQFTTIANSQLKYSFWSITLFNIDWSDIIFLYQNVLKYSSHLYSLAIDSNRKLLRKISRTNDWNRFIELRLFD